MDIFFIKTPQSRSNLLYFTLKKSLWMKSLWMKSLWNYSGIINFPTENSHCMTKWLHPKWHTLEWTGNKLRHRWHLSYRLHRPRSFYSFNTPDSALQVHVKLIMDCVHKWDEIVICPVQVKAQPGSPYDNPLKSAAQKKQYPLEKQ